MRVFSADLKGVVFQEVRVFMAMVLLFAALMLAPFGQLFAAWPQGVPAVLSASDEAVYQKIFADAGRGKMPAPTQVRRLKETSLLADAEALALSEGKQSYDLLKGWINNNPDHALASTLYRQAVKTRPSPRKVCKKEVRRNSKGVRYDHRACRSSGSYAALPNKPTALVERESRQARLEAERTKRPAAVSAMLSEVWNLRSRDRLQEAGEILLSAEAKRVLDSADRQAQLVKIAARYDDIRLWERGLPFAKAAGEIAGPGRDEALWLAGWSAYRLGKTTEAAKLWDKLVSHEPVKGAHYGRAAWWAARAYSEAGQRTKAKEMLALGAKDHVSFYGMLCAQKAGVEPSRDWRAPRLNREHMAALVQIPSVKRGMALAQIGEHDLAQQVLKNADDVIPYQMTETLAAFALEARLPGTAQRMGRALYEQGDMLFSALFPYPAYWQPKGGMAMDRGLMLAIMRQESAFQPSVGSHAGAQGLMQLMPATSKYIARLAGRPTPSRDDLHDPAINLMLAQDYVGYLNGKLSGNIIHILAAYNAGPGNLNKWRTRGLLPDGDPMMAIENIPLAETKGYVQKVLANWWFYQSRTQDDAWSLAALADNHWPVVDERGRGRGARVAQR